MEDRIRAQALVIACAGASPSPSRLASIQSTAGSVNWSLFEAAAVTHGLLPVVLTNLQRAHVPVPATVATLAAQLTETTTRDNLALMAQLAGLFALLEAHGIPAVAWKGPTFAATAYGSLSLRNCCDLDVLVPLGRIGDLQALLNAHSYATPAISRWLQPLARRERHFIPRQAGWNTVEAQTSVAPWSMDVRIRAEDLITRAVPVTVAGRSVPTLSPEDTLLAIAVHGAGHAWSGLRLVADVDACAHAAIDWALVQQRARAAGVGRILAVAVLLAADLFDTSVPPAIIDAARADRVAGWLARSLARTLRTPGAPRSRDWIGVLSRERAIDGLRFGARQFYLRCVTRRTMPAA